MKKFLLLRNNKQSGPYSAEDLQQMGLKPYDLIWVNGKSAAWRYPGEIEELKSFAPAVEEQPYDRFYKKHTDTPAVPPVSSPAAVQPQQQPVEKPSRKKEYKRIFVTLPSGASVQSTKQPIEEKPITPYNENIPAEKPIQQNTFTSPKATSGFAKHEVKESQADIYFPKKRRRFKAVPIALMVIGMLAMAGLGIVIGMTLVGNKPFSLIKRTDPVPPVTNNQQSAVPDDPRNTGITSDQATAQAIQDSIARKDSMKRVVKTPVIKKNTALADTNQQNVAANIPVNQEPEIKQDEASIKKDPPKPAMPDFDKLVSVSNNDFEVGPFGGISKLALTVKNTSEYDLNLVVVQLEYIKANKEVFKTENVYFRDVAANSTLTVDAPKSSRGNKINYKITLINSKDHLYHAGN